MRATKVEKGLEGKCEGWPRPLGLLGPEQSRLTGGLSAAAAPHREHGDTRLSQVGLGAVWGLGLESMSSGGFVVTLRSGFPLHQLLHGIVQ